MTLRLILVFWLCALAFASPLRAETDNAKQKLDAIEDKLNRQKEQAAALDMQAKEASEGLKDLQKKLVAAAQSMAAKEAEQERLEDKLDRLEKDTGTKGTVLGGEQRKLKALTAALVEISRQPPESLFLQTGMTTDYIHRAIVLRTVLPRIREQTDSISRDIVSLDDLKGQMAEQERLTKAARANLADQQKGLDQLIKVRQGLLQRTESQKEAISRQLVSLSSQAKDLHQLLEKVTPRNTRKANVYSGFSPVLKRPVTGRIIRQFGDRDADGVKSEGITFAGLPGSPVVAPRAGRVVFAGPFKGYGQIVILQHDGGYHSFMAGFGRIDADMGQDVEAGEPLGVLPAKADARPELYFEWRRNADPVDPAGPGGKF